MGVQPATLDPGLVRAEPSADAEPPTCNVASVSVDIKMGTVTVTGSAQDTGVCSSFFYFLSTSATLSPQKQWQKPAVCGSDPWAMGLATKNENTALCKMIVHPDQQSDREYSKMYAVGPNHHFAKRENDSSGQTSLLCDNPGSRSSLLFANRYAFLAHPGAGRGCCRRGGQVRRGKLAPR
jgi:hypothetical protein